MSRNQKANTSKLMAVALLLLLVVAFSLVLFQSIALVKVHDRGQTCQLNNMIISKINDDTKGMNVAEIIDYSIDFTAKQLTPSWHNNMDKRKMNCVGYARYCASVCNQALANNGIDGSAKPVVGYIKIAGVNLCKAAKSLCLKQRHRNFVKDHDFVELRIGDKVYYFDPILYDIIGNNCMTTAAAQPPVARQEAGDVM